MYSGEDFRSRVQDEDADLELNLWKKAEKVLNDRWQVFEATRSARSERALNFSCTSDDYLACELGGKPEKYLAWNPYRNLTLALAKDIGPDIVYMPETGDKRNPDMARYYLHRVLHANKLELSREDDRLLYARALYVIARWRQRDGKDTPENRALIIDDLRRSTALDYRPAMSALAGLYRKHAIEIAGSGDNISPEVRAEITRLLTRALPDPEAYYWLALTLADEPGSQAAAYAMLKQAAQAGYDTALREYALWSFYGNCDRGQKAVFEVDWAQAYWAYQQLDLLSKEDDEYLQRIVPEKLPKATPFAAEQLTKLMLLLQGPYERPEMRQVALQFIDSYINHKNAIYEVITAQIPKLIPEQAFLLLDALIQPANVSGDKAIERVNTIDQLSTDKDRRNTSIFFFNNESFFTREPSSSSIEPTQEGEVSSNEDPNMSFLTDLLAGIKHKTREFNYYFLLRTLLHKERNPVISSLFGKSGQLTKVRDLKIAQELYARLNRLDTTLNRPAMKIIPVSVKTEERKVMTEVTKDIEVDGKKQTIVEKSEVVLLQAIKPASDDPEDLEFMPSNETAEINIHVRMITPGDLHLCIYLNATSQLKKVMRVKPIFFELPSEVYPIESLRSLKCHALDYALSLDNYPALALLFLTAAADATQQEKLSAWTLEVSRRKEGMKALNSLCNALVLALMQADYLTADERQVLLKFLPTLLAPDAADPKAAPKAEAPAAENSPLLALLETHFCHSVMKITKDPQVSLATLLPDLIAGNWQALVEKMGWLIFQNHAQHPSFTEPTAFTAVTIENYSLLSCVTLARQFLLGLGQPQSLLTATQIFEKILTLKPTTEQELLAQLLLSLEMAALYHNGAASNPALAMTYYSEVLRLMAENTPVIDLIAEKKMAEAQTNQERLLLSMVMISAAALPQISKQIDLVAAQDDYARYALWASFGIQLGITKINDCYEHLLRINDYEFKPLDSLQKQFITRCVTQGEQTCQWDRYLATYYCVASNNISALQGLIGAGLTVCRVTPTADAKMHLLSLAFMLANANVTQDYRLLTVLLASTPLNSISLTVAKNLKDSWETLLATAKGLAPKMPNKSFAAEFEQLQTPLLALVARLEEGAAHVRVGFLPPPRVEEGNIVVHAEQAGELRK
jgi:hypothetical protein